MVVDINWLRQQALMNNYGGLVDDGSNSPIQPDYQDATPNDFPDQPDFSSLFSPQPRALRTPEMPAQIPRVEAPTAPGSLSAEELAKQEMDMIAKLYTPSTVASDRLNRMIDTAPDINKYQPGALRTIGSLGMMLGPGGFKGAEEALYSPFARESASWKERITPAQQAATIENQSNNIERQLATSAVTNATNINRNAQQDAINQEKNRIAKIIADATMLKARGYNVKVEGARVVATNPNTLERIDLGPSGGMNRVDELNLENQGRVDAAKAGADAAMSRQIAGGGGIFEITNPDGTKSYARPDPNDPSKMIAVTPPTQGTMTKPGTTPTPPGDKPGDVPKNIQNTLEQLYMTDEDAKQYIQLNPDTGKYQMIPKPVAGQRKSGLPYFGTYYTQADVDGWQRVADQTYGPSVSKGQTAPVAGRGGGAPAPNQGAMPTPSAGGKAQLTPQQLSQFSQDQLSAVDSGKKLIVIDAKGNPVGLIPNTQDQIDEAIRRKYRVQVGR